MRDLIKRTLLIMQIYFMLSVREHRNSNGCSVCCADHPLAYIHIAFFPRLFSVFLSFFSCLVKLARPINPILLSSSADVFDVEPGRNLDHQQNKASACRAMWLQFSHVARAKWATARAEFRIIILVSFRFFFSPLTLIRLKLGWHARIRTSLLWTKEEEE